MPSSHSIYLIEYKKTGKEDDEEEAEILADEKKMMTRGFGRRKSKQHVSRTMASNFTLLPTVL